MKERLPPDWDKEEKMWKSGELFTYFADWKVERIDEVIFEDNICNLRSGSCTKSASPQYLETYE